MASEFNIDKTALEQQVKTIIERSKAEYNTEEYKRIAFSCIDLTTLNATDTPQHVTSFTKKVNDFKEKYPEIENVAAICVYPNMAAVVENSLQLPEVEIAAVAGGFPSSMTFRELKVQEAKMAIEKGADEIDIVMSLSHFLSGEFEKAHQEIAEIKRAIGEKHLKVILETGALQTSENIWKASLLAINAGADFIKTSTGKIQPAATPEAAYVMCLAIAYHYEQTGEKVGFKPAGGISTPADALIYLAIVDEILGDEWMNQNLFRIGASRLANNLLADITGDNQPFF